MNCGKIYKFQAYILMYVLKLWQGDNDNALR